MCRLSFPEQFLPADALSDGRLCVVAAAHGQVLGITEPLPTHPLFVEAVAAADALHAKPNAKAKAAPRKSAVPQIPLTLQLRLKLDCELRRFRVLDFTF